MTAPLFRREALDHKKGALFGEVLVLPSLSSYFVILSILLLVLMCAGFLFWGRYARDVSVQGYLVPQDGVVRVFPSQPGVVAQVLVREGEVVREAQPLIEIHSNRVTRDGTSLSKTIVSEYYAELRSIETRIDRQYDRHEQLKAELEQTQAALAAEIALLRKERDTLNARLRIATQRLKRMKSMASKGMSPQVVVEELEENVLAQEAEIQAVERLLANQVHALAATELQALRLPLDNQDAIVALESDMRALRHKIVEAESAGGTIIQAPRSGEVSGLLVRVGQEAPIGAPLMDIVPVDSPLRAELLIPPEAAGFIKVDQQVLIRFDAFPYQKFGTVRGTVSRIGRSVVLPKDLIWSPPGMSEPVYVIDARLHNESIAVDGEDVPLRPGMTLQADVRLAERSFMEWLLEPLHVFRERGDDASTYEQPN